MKRLVFIMSEKSNEKKQTNKQKHKIYLRVGVKKKHYIKKMKKNLVSLMTLKHHQMKSRNRIHLIRVQSVNEICM